MSVQDAEMKAAAHRAGPQVERGFAAFAESWRECQTAKSERH
jgi:hypothetical protein